MTTLKMKNRVLTIGLAVLLFTALAFYSPGTSASAVYATAGTAQNEALDFLLVNQTGYAIKALYIGAAGTGDWTNEDEILKGRVFGTGVQVPIKFSPKATAEKWDIMVSWSDGSGNVEWLNLKLTEITKVTLRYNKEKDETFAVIE
jgi:hypothetical protein